MGTAWRTDLNSLNGVLRRGGLENPAWRARELLLQVEQFVIKAVVLAVADARMGEHVIGVVVLADLIGQVGVAGLGFSESHRGMFRSGARERIRSHIAERHGLAQALVGIACRNELLTDIAA